MKEYRKISFLTGMFLIAVIAFGQATSKSYLYKVAPFNIDSIFKPASSEMLHNNHTEHISLSTLNDQFVDTSHASINSMAVPTFHQIKNHSLLAGSQSIQKQMNAGSYYQPHFFQTMPTLGGILPMNYNPINAPYPALPYGYTPYSNKATASPYYILPKY